MSERPKGDGGFASVPIWNGDPPTRKICNLPSTPSDEHMATAREVTRAWTPQTTLADSRRDIATAIAAAEERGRRSGVEERDREWLVAVNQSEDGRYSEALKDLLSAALAPRDSGKETT